MWKALSKIIQAAATSRLGIWALIIVVLGLTAFFFFHREPLLFKVGIFAFLFIGLAVVGFFASRISSDSEPRRSETGVPSDSKTSSKAQSILDDAKQHYLLDRNDQARTAYTEARALFKADGDRLGEANVLLGLGELEHALGRNDQARTAYTEARTLFEAVGPHETAPLLPSEHYNVPCARCSETQRKNAGSHTGSHEECSVGILVQTASCFSWCGGRHPQRAHQWQSDLPAVGMSREE